MKTSNLDDYAAVDVTRGGRGRARAGGSIHILDQSGNDAVVSKIILNGISLQELTDDDAILTAEFGTVELSIVSPDQLTANTDDWDPDPDGTGATIIRASTDASRNLTGMLPPDPVNEAIKIIANVGSFDLVLKHDQTSTAANRFLCPDNSDYTVKRNSSVTVIYDTTSSRWRVVSGAATASSVLGAWQTYTPAWTSDGTAPAIGNGTLTGRYRLLDATSMQIWVRFVRGSTSTNGTGNYFFSMPSGFKGALNISQPVSGFLLDAGTRNYVANAFLTGSATTFYVIHTEAGGAGIFGGGAPFTLATGDELDFSGVIEYALV